MLDIPNRFNYKNLIQYINYNVKFLLIYYLLYLKMLQTNDLNQTSCEILELGIGMNMKTICGTEVILSKLSCYSGFSKWNFIVLTIDSIFGTWNWNC